MKTIIDQIEAITRQTGFIYTFALILLRDLFFSPEDATDINWNEHLNFQELTFLGGLLVKAAINLGIPEEAESAVWFEEIYRLFDELHKKHHEHFLEQIKIRVEEGTYPAKNADEDYRNTFGSGTMMTEPIFYGGSGAYDFQYLDFAAQKYAADSQWIRDHIEIEITQMGQIARELKSLHERKYNSREPIMRGEFSKLCTAALSVFSFDEADLQKFGSDSVKAFVRAFH